ncbi:type IV pilus modification protein PilV [Dokdonella soli]
MPSSHSIAASSRCEASYGSLRGRQSGATLIEVLVTVAVTSIGLLGMAGLMIVSTKIDRDAYLATQADFIAQTLIESMRINTSAVADGRYDGTYAGSGAPDPGCMMRGCSPGERADYDRARFDTALHTMLPNATAALKCSGGDPRASGSASIYDGTCRLEIRWSERAPNAVAVSGAQSLAWVFQP